MLANSDKFWAMKSERENSRSGKADSAIDTESERFLSQISALEFARSNHIPGVRTVLVVLSSAGMVYDLESMRQKVLWSYPDATVFFQTTDGKSVGAASPQHVDLLIDFTGRGQRQPLLHAKRLRRTTRVAVGRKTGFFRKRLYDRLLEEKPAVGTGDAMEHERSAQKQVLALAGVVVSQSGESGPDRGRTIPRELPPMQQLA
ncbi:MAG: hypothetical protein A2X94_16890 [Bdellovibrionales bacterium GWB1_55_8]|nr:MAG: hypothetical protein A2X94_16890 [Bdellovibrionales bacterium GWB1_55_8]